MCEVTYHGVSTRERVGEKAKYEVYDFLVSSPPGGAKIVMSMSDCVCLFTRISQKPADDRTVIIFVLARFAVAVVLGPPLTVL